MVQCKLSLEIEYERGWGRLIFRPQPLFTFNGLININPLKVKQQTIALNGRILLWQNDSDENREQYLVSLPYPVPFRVHVS